jgi:hypothetical protein
MRPFTAVLGLVALILPGCVTQWLNPRPPADRGLPVESMTVEKVVASLNENAQKIQSLRSTEMDITTTMTTGVIPQSFNTHGLMVFQKPRSFRLKVNALGKQEADIGSNDQEFWWWISRDEQPYLYHVSHSDFAASQGRIRLPFQPDWIIEALGVGEYDPRKPYQLKSVGTNTWQLEERAQAPDGQAVLKITVLSRNGPDRIAVSAHRVLDKDGHEIFSARVTQVQRDQRTFAVVPKVVELNWPAQKLHMTMRLNEVMVNPQLPAPGASDLFVRPNPVGIRSYNLARGPDPVAGQLQRAGGYRNQ